MAKFTSPVLGYNNNVRHKNRVFHIQTEDSGVNHPHIITHLFMDGGRILKSMKRSYAEHVGSEGLTETVRGLMKEQHKAMFIALRDGQFDALVDGHVNHAAQGSEITKAPKAEGSSPKPPVSAPKAAESAPRAAESSPKPPAAEAKPADAEAKPAVEPKAAPPASEQVPATAPEAGAAAAAAAPASEQAPPTDPGSPPSVAPRPPSSDATKRSAPPLPSGRKSGAPAAAPRPAAQAKPSDLTMDFDALGKAAEGAIAPQPFFTSDELPPPPKTAVATRSTGGGYSNVEERAPASSVGRPSTRHSGAEELRATPATRGGAVRSEPSRYAPARPAAIFGQPRASKAPPSSQSLFGDDLVGDKSLDEVILSYLAEDLERGK